MSVRASKVSVIIPNYNHARYLPQRIESVLGQSFADFELLILDDTSTDDSIAVIERYLGDPRVRFEPNSVNSGSPYRQWAKGLAMTGGEYVWVAESDDFADPALLETLVAALDAHPGAGIAMGMLSNVDGEGRDLGGYFDRWHDYVFTAYGPNPFTNGPLAMAGRDYLARYMTPFNTIPNASGALFRRSALAAAGGPVTDMRICGDWFTYCRMLALSDIIVVPDMLNYFRTHENNVRTLTRASDFVRESFTVRDWVARTTGTQPSPEAVRCARDFYAQMLLHAERRGDAHKVPLGRIGAVLRSAMPFGAGMTMLVARLLLHERAATIRARLRGRPAPVPS